VNTRPIFASQKGMTLVEIMVVIAILGTIMSVVAFVAVGKIDEANCEATVLTIKNADQALELYAAKKKGRYPSTSDGLEAAKKYFNDGDVPQDAWGQDFQYYAPAPDGSPYGIVSVGKDGSEGGDGPDGDINSWELGDETCDW
jgi:general secretion pathway protein G